MLDHRTSVLFGQGDGSNLPPEDGPNFAFPTTKQNGRLRRLTAVKRNPSTVLAVTLRTGLMVGFAVLLILVLLPAAIAAQAAGLR